MLQGCGQRGVWVRIQTLPGMCVEVFGQEWNGSLHTGEASMLENELDLTHSMLYTRYPQLPNDIPLSLFSLDPGVSLN